MTHSDLYYFFAAIWKAGWLTCFWPAMIFAIAWQWRQERAKSTRKLPPPIPFPVKRKPPRRADATVPHLPPAA